jgi:uncharacterized protein (TIGR00251 family)
VGRQEITLTKVHLESRNDGVVIPVRAKPAARRNAIEGVHDGALRVSVTPAPERGKANKAICDLIARTLGLNKSRVTLIQGEASPHKHVLVCGMTADEIQASLQQLIDN